MRVSKACEKLLVEKHSEHTVEIIDPLNYDFGDVFKPEFSYHRSKVPAHLAELADKIAKADGYVMVSPECNHSMSPALASILFNPFVAPLFSYKPSAIVTYSAGQWGQGKSIRFDANLLIRVRLFTGFCDDSSA